MTSALLRARVRVRRFFRSSTERLAGLATSIYLSSVIILISYRMPEISTLPLNELGDFLAGAFGPLAVFWLVLGYYQQGKELKLSSKALMAQCIELANSAEQQRLALEVSRDQMLLAKERHKIEMLELEESIRPRVSLKFLRRGHSHGKNWVDLEIVIFNAAAHDLDARWQEGGVELQAMASGYMGIKAKETFQIDFARNDIPASLDVAVYCKNVRGVSYGYHFTVTGSSGNEYVIAHPPTPTTIQ